MNGYPWQVMIADPHDPKLVDRTNVLRVATTDPIDYIVYLSGTLKGDFLTRVLIHELGHCAMISFNLIEEIHRMVYPEYWIDAEEWICNFIADYGMTILNTGYSILGNYEGAWMFVPKEIERMLLNTDWKGTLKGYGRGTYN